MRKTQDIEHLREFARDFLRKNFAVELEIPLDINPRLTHAQGRYIHLLRIELAGPTIENGCDEAILGVLKHELVHYALHKLGLPFKDGEDYFEETLRRLDVPPSGSTIIGVYTDMVCSDCGKYWYSREEREALVDRLLFSPCCEARLNVGERRSHDGSIRYDKLEEEATT